MHITVHNHLPKRKTRDGGESNATEQVNKFGSLDYLSNMYQFSGLAEWPDGKKTGMYFMAKTLEEAKQRFKSQVNSGGWPKITNVKLAKTRPEPR
jgi:hypothetical protein